MTRLIRVSIAGIGAKIIGHLWLLLLITAMPAAADYFPGQHWAARTPKAAGFDSSKLAAAIQLAQENETRLPPALAQYLDVRDLPKVRSMYTFTNEPFDEVIGPMAPRGPFTGLIIKDGYIIAQWGDVERVDMTHSISKTFLSSVAGLAVDEGLIRNVDDRVATYVPTDHFQGAHNSQITWDHFLRQTSFWRGTLWGSLIGQTAPVKSLGLSSHVRRQHLAPNGNTMMFE